MRAIDAQATTQQVWIYSEQKSWTLVLRRVYPTKNRTKENHTIPGHKLLLGSIYRHLLLSYYSNYLRFYIFLYKWNENYQILPKSQDYSTINWIHIFSTTLHCNLGQIKKYENIKRKGVLISISCTKYAKMTFVSIICMDNRVCNPFSKFIT